MITLFTIDIGTSKLYFRNSFKQQKSIPKIITKQETNDTIINNYIYDKFILRV